MNLYYIGRFVKRQKRVDRLLDLAQILSKDNVDFKIIIYGNSSDLYLNLKFDLKKHFIFKGYSSSWVNDISNDSIKIMVSDYEGCPLSLLEANKNGLTKIIVLDMPGVDNYVSKNCIAKDVEDMAEKILRKDDLTNYMDLTLYYDNQRFYRAIESFYKLI